MLTVSLVERGKIAKAGSLDEALARAKAMPDLRLWVDLETPTSTEVQQVTAALGLHPLVHLILQRGDARLPRVSAVGESILLDLSAYNPEGAVTTRDFVGLVLLMGPGFVMTAHWRPVAALKVARERLNGESNAVQPENIALLVLDAIADGMIDAAERLEEQVGEIENVLISTRRRNIPQSLVSIRRTLMKVRRLLVFQQDALERLARLESRILGANDRMYLDDILHRASHAEALSESVVLVNESVLNAHLAVVNNRMNDVMKVLTVVGTIFLPLTFMTGLFGTNFDPLPGAKGHSSFWIFVGVAAMLMLGTLAYFYRLGWLKPED